jgi:hypothetical protein
MIFTDLSGMYQYLLSSQNSTVTVAILTMLSWQLNYITKSVNFNIKFSNPYFHNTILETCHLSVCIFMNFIKFISRTIHSYLFQKLCSNTQVLFKNKHCHLSSIFTIYAFMNFY